MPSKSKNPHRERFPDYGVPYSMIRYGTCAERVLYYAKFKKTYFSFEEYKKFYCKELRTDTYRDAVDKLCSNGWLHMREDGKTRITPAGASAILAIAARNARNPKRKND